MTEPVDADQIETIVGAKRHATRHIACAVSKEQTVYILHSDRCKMWLSDLTRCPYSVALDNGIHPADWKGVEDRPVVIRISATGDRIVPMLSESRFIERIGS